MAHAYQQVPLSEESNCYMTINTHKGLFQYNWMPFGVHSAPAIFQRAMEGLLSDISSTVVYIDDILITGKDEEEHLRNVDSVWRVKVWHWRRQNVNLCWKTSSTWTTLSQQRVFSHQRARQKRSRKHQLHRIYRNSVRSSEWQTTMPDS